MVGTLSTTDDDIIHGDSLTYTLSGEDARFFEITADGVLKLKDGFQADYERDSQLSVQYYSHR